MKKFFEFLRKPAMKTFNVKKKKMRLLAKQQQKSYDN